VVNSRKQDGVDPDVFADCIFERLEDGGKEIVYGKSETRRLPSRAELDAGFDQLTPP